MQTNNLRSKVKSPLMILGFKKEWIEIQLRWNIIKLVLRYIKNPKKVLRVLKGLTENRKLVLGPNRIKKVAKIDNRYYYDLYTPSWH